MKFADACAGVSAGLRVPLPHYVNLAPAIIFLITDARLLAGFQHYFAIRHQHINLALQIHSIFSFKTFLLNALPMLVPFVELLLHLNSL